MKEMFKSIDGQSPIFMKEMFKSINGQSPIFMKCLNLSLANHRYL